MKKSNMRLVDAHCDTILKCFQEPSYQLGKNPGHISIEKMREGGALAQFFAIYIDRELMKTMDPYDIFQGVYRCYCEELENNKSWISPAYALGDIEKNQRAGKISAMLAIEDGVAIGEKIERIKEFFDRGVRLITLTWNFENAIGFPCSENSASHQMGLKPFGIEVVKELNKFGILIDVSHLSEGGFYDVARYAEAPFVASHSCARELCNHCRNLTDEQLRLLGEKGGFVGVNFYAPFLRERADYASIDDIVRHIRYMVHKAGIESVGLGSDFDGIDSSLQIGDYSGYPLLIQELEKIFKPSDVDKICRDNMLRVIVANTTK